MIYLYIHVHTHACSERLLLASKDFKKQSKYANLRALWRNIAPLIVVAFIIILVLYLRFFR